jgi:hypothetical protein
MATRVTRPGPGESTAVPKQASCLASGQTWLVGPIFGSGRPEKHGLWSKTGQLEARVAVEPWGSAAATHVTEEPRVEAT